MDKIETPKASREEAPTLDDLHRAADAFGNPEKNGKETSALVGSALGAEPENGTEDPKVAEPKAAETKPKEDEGEPAKPDTKALDDNAERSKLGRKVKYLEDMVARLGEELKASKQKPKGVEEDEEFVPPQTREEFFALLDKREKAKEAQRQEEQLEYSSKYLEFVARIGVDEEENLHEEIVKELTTATSQFNVRYSNDPVADAERNYYKAKAYILSQKTKALEVQKPKDTPKENPLKGEKPIAPLGVSGDSKVAGRGKPKIELDDAAKDYIRSVGMSSEEVEAAFSSDESIGMSRHR